MENPCIGCAHSWSAGRNCSCANCCDSLRTYKEEQAMAREIITEEYDKLADQTQCNYWYCQKCGKYVLRSWSKKCLCEEG